jgi:DNA-binding transcriptional MerR regulator
MDPAIGQNVAAMEGERLLSSIEVCKIAGCTYRQIDHWVAVGVVHPVVPARGPGSERKFTREEARRVKAITILRSEGIPLEKIRTMIQVPQIGRLQLARMESALAELAS